jgi:ABC-type multidrug transport system fused ATPase/permease subunit
MDQVMAGVTAALRKFLGLPPGAGVLFPRRLRVQLTLIVSGTLLLSLLEVAALAFAYATLQLTSAETAADLPPTLQRLVGDTPLPTAAAVFGCGVLVAYVLKALLNTAFSWWTSGVLMRVQVDMSTTLLSRFLRAPYAFHLRTNTSDILGTVNDAVAKVYGMVVAGAVAGLAETFTITMVALTVFVAAPVPTAVGAVYFFLAVWTFQRWARPRLVEAGQQSQRGTQHSYKAAMEAIGAVREVQLGGSEKYFVDRFRTAREQSAKADRMTNLLAAVPRNVLEVLFVVGVGLMGLVAFRSGPGSTVMSSLGIIVLGGFRVLPSINRLMASLNIIQGGLFALDIVVGHFREGQRLPAPTRDVAPLPFSESLVLDGVSFRYEGTDDVVLHDVDIRIEVGTSVALVGGSGAGKSTVVDVLTGFLVPDHGQVLVDGVDMRSHLEQWRADIGMVPQDVWLLDASLRENIALGEVDRIDVDRLMKAVADAQLTDLVASLPDGLDTRLGERGSRFSGGQRQRVGVARALYRQPRLLVMDEATSALDNLTERQIIDTVNGLKGKLTSILVAHRLSTVKNCDLVVLLDNGRVADQGSFAELRERNRDFAHLVSLGDLR